MWRGKKNIFSVLIAALFFFGSVFAAYAAELVVDTKFVTEKEGK